MHEMYILAQLMESKCNYLQKIQKAATFHLDNTFGLAMILVSLFLLHLLWMILESINVLLVQMIMVLPSILTLVSMHGPDMFMLLLMSLL